MCELFSRTLLMYSECLEMKTTVKERMIITERFVRGKLNLIGGNELTHPTHCPDYQGWNIWSKIVFASTGGKS